MEPATLNELASPQNLLLIVLIIVASWAVVELALMLRKARQAVDELTNAANETIGQVQPIITKLDNAMDELQPSLDEVQPLVEKVELTLDEANVSLAKVNGILGDVSDMSSTASSVTTSVKNATAAAASSVAGLVGRVSGGGRHGSAAIAAPAAESRLGEGTPEGAPKDDGAREHAHERAQGQANGGYITYGANNKVVAESAEDVAKRAGGADVSDLDEPDIDLGTSSEADDTNDLSGVAAAQKAAAGSVAKEG